MIRRGRIFNHIVMKALKYISSPWTTCTALLLPAAVYVGMSFGGAPYGPFLDFILGSAAGLALYLLLLLNLLAWSVLAVINRKAPESVDAQMVMEMDEYIHMPGEGGMRSLDDAREWIEGMGLGVHGRGEGIIARKGASGIIPGIVLRAALVLVMLSVMMSFQLRRTGEALVAEGGRQGATHPASVLGLEVLPLQIRAELSPEFMSIGKSGFGLDEASVRLVVDGLEFTATGGYPVRAAGLYWRVEHLGYWQHLSYADTPGSLMLDVLPPGKASAYPLLDGGEVFEFRLAPDRKVKKGLISGEVFNLRSPRYVLSPRARKGGDIMLGVGQSAMVGGSEAALTDPGLYVRLRVVSDPALPLLRLGFTLLALGILLMLVRLFWYERRFIAVMHEGRVLIGYSEEFYKKWGIYKFRKWVSSSHVHIT